MELSQTALAMLLLGGLPAGAAISLVYAFTDFSGANQSFGKRFLMHVKDFFFVVLAGLVAVLLVYYVNEGEFRYLVLLGMVVGYVLTHFLLAGSVRRVRNAVLCMISVPIVWLWSFTLGRLCAKARMTAQVRMTEKKGRELEILASNGF